MFINNKNFKLMLRDLKFIRRLHIPLRSIKYKFFLFNSKKYFIYCKILIVTIVFPIFTFSCSLSERITFSPIINQGSYFSFKDISKIDLGMTQQQVTNILGTPVIIDPFNTNTWFYIFYQLSKNKVIVRRFLLLNFSNEGILINIDSNLTQ